MSFNWVDMIGIGAGICTTAAVLPQLKKAWQTRQVKDVSLGMFIVLIIGVSLWTVYGILKEDIAIILFNGISVGLNAFLLYLLLRYGSGKQKDGKG